MISDDLLDCFDFSQTPAHFATVQTKRTVGYFLHQQASGLPDDD